MPKASFCASESTSSAVNQKIWRLFEVDSRLYLNEFHDVLQVIMGWENSHLHSFTDRNPNTPGRGSTPARSWAPDYARAEDDEGWYLPEETVQLGKILNEGSTPLFYEYDFGDGWLHRIDWIETVKKTTDDVSARAIRESDVALRKTPVGSGATKTSSLLWPLMSLMNQTATMSRSCANGLREPRKDPAAKKPSTQHTSTRSK